MAQVQSGGAAGGALQPVAQSALEQVHTLLASDVLGATPVACPVAGCDKSCKTRQALVLHLKCHPAEQRAAVVIPDAVPARRGRCHCFVAGCTYAPGGKSLVNVKKAQNHYHQMHGVKVLRCTHAGCTKTFAKGALLNRHVQNAHSSLKCKCGTPFASAAALRKHVKQFRVNAPEAHAAAPHA